MSIQSKKNELLSIIAWKLSRGSETKPEAEKIMRECRKMSYKALHEFAIRNDFIDY